MKRRRFLTAGTLGVASGVAGIANAQSQQCNLHPNPATFVLVHGAWAGGFVYNQVADILRARGHRVYTPTLAGLAEHSHLLSRNIDLTTHVTDIVNVFRFNDLEEVVLAGHSYGGVPVTGAADQLADRISSLVYLDALVPTHGQSVRDIRGEQAIPLDTELPISIPLTEAMADGFGVPIGELWKYTEMPTGPLIEPLRLTGALNSIRRKTYVWANRSPQFKTFYDARAADSSWRTSVIDTSHMLMLDAPERTAELLEEAI
jgi:pimeloyl-ACP methyl ester carboxylesterase